MIDWLKLRLPPMKLKTESWIQLSEAVQEYWEENFDPLIDKLKSLRSIYSAGTNDRLLMISDMGPFEEYVLTENVPIVYSTKQMDFLKKDCERLILNTIRRAFPNSRTFTWAPLYANVLEVYGTAFYLEDQFEQGVTYYMTSRAMVLVSGALNQGMADKITDYVNDLKPLHIVFEGVQFEE
jgi:hypothetical protein